eukprot:TRINITY_DN439_c1_g1_i1.p1 TRINITY_DN439_c1_g1~~TRINITY_DN439_c1_g1_i1.p1  ORF type:complete len:964 (-),score=250.01 TRINITY_DN439_c1_g1_i1:36-2927(-)
MEGTPTLLKSLDSANSNFSKTKFHLRKVRLNLAPKFDGVSYKRLGGERPRTALTLGKRKERRSDSDLVNIKQDRPSTAAVDKKVEIVENDLKSIKSHQHRSKIELTPPDPLPRISVEDIERELAEHASSYRNRLFKRPKTAQSGLKMSKSNTNFGITAREFSRPSAFLSTTKTNGVSTTGSMGGNTMKKRPSRALIHSRSSAASFGRTSLSSSSSLVKSKRPGTAASRQSNIDSLSNDTLRKSKSTTTPFEKYQLPMPNAIEHHTPLPPKPKFTDADASTQFDMASNSLLAANIDNIFKNTSTPLSTENSARDFHSPIASTRKSLDINNVVAQNTGRSSGLRTPKRPKTALSTSSTVSLNASTQIPSSTLSTPENDRIRTQREETLESRAKLSMQHAESLETIVKELVSDRDSWKQNFRQEAQARIKLAETLEENANLRQELNTYKHQLQTHGLRLNAMKNQMGKVTKEGDVWQHRFREEVLKQAEAVDFESEHQTREAKKWRLKYINERDAFSRLKSEVESNNMTVISSGGQQKMEARPSISTSGGMELLGNNEDPTKLAEAKEHLQVSRFIFLDANCFVPLQPLVRYMRGQVFSSDEPISYQLEKVNQITGQLFDRYLAEVPGGYVSEFREISIKGYSLATCLSDMMLDRTRIIYGARNHISAVVQLIRKSNHKSLRLKLLGILLGVLWPQVYHPQLASILLRFLQLCIASDEPTLEGEKKVGFQDIFQSKPERSFIIPLTKILKAFEIFTPPSLLVLLKPPVSAEEKKRQQRGGKKKAGGRPGTAKPTPKGRNNQNKKNRRSSVKKSPKNAEEGANGDTPVELQEPFVYILDDDLIKSLVKTTYSLVKISAAAEDVSSSERTIDLDILLEHVIIIISQQLSRDQNRVLLLFDQSDDSGEGILNRSDLETLLQAQAPECSPQDIQAIIRETSNRFSSSTFTRDAVLTSFAIGLIRPLKDDE